jgi:hypothetical protein
MAEPTHTRFADFPVHADVGFTTGDPENPTPVGPLAPATTTVIGGVKMSAHIANAAGAAPTAAEYDALLAALIAAGIMSAT